MKRPWLMISSIFLLCHAAPLACDAALVLTPAEIEKIAHKIFENECAGNDEYLLSWNQREEFLSLGIGHFIWYPANNRGPFDEGFPQLIAYLHERETPLPAWLARKPLPACPWTSRDDFTRNRHSTQAQELWHLLRTTKHEQALFIINRLNTALPLLLKKAPVTTHAHINAQFHHLTDTPAGTYALIDYINFKGLGTAENERYNAQGWGLLQVLMRMNAEGPGDAVKAFVAAADTLLTKRVTNAPPHRKEEKWLPGWQKRIRTYEEF